MIENVQRDGILRVAHLQHGGVVLHDRVVERGLGHRQPELGVPLGGVAHLLGEFHQLGDDLGRGQGPVGVAVDRVVEPLGERRAWTRLVRCTVRISSLSSLRSMPICRFGLSRS